MKVTKETKAFQPITIVLETQGEVYKLQRALMSAAGNYPASESLAFWHTLLNELSEKLK